MNRREWEALPGARKIPRHYADEDLEQDLHPGEAVQL
jgi:predicted HTH domain antitoxin